MLKPGDTAPQFELPDQDGNIVRTKDLLGTRWLGFFYPQGSTYRLL